MNQNKTKGLLFAILGSVLWGGSGTAAQFVFHHQSIDPIWLVGVRLLTAGSLLIVYSFLKNGRKIFTIFYTKSNILWLILFALLGMVPSQLTYFLAIKFGNAATATILQFMGPLFIILALAVGSRTLPRRIDVISILVALIGTLLLVTKGNLGSLALAPLAVFRGLMAGVGQANYTLIPRLLLKNFDAALVTGWAMLIGSIPFAKIIITNRPASIDPASILLIVYIIVGGTMLSYLFYLSSLNYLKPDTTGMLSSFEPLTATLLSILLLGVHFGLAETIGGLLILTTAFLQALPTRKKIV
ncbi:DMT family transporter [Pediococcus pentosaceus]|uniref:DMT family transporter n=1 Tax=Pediococcus pentosaceus TaxID=1255 RepID=UPI002360E486|nr:DMT family transporter [Pediococcus pentosaceus]MDD1389399.1 DMT family transporter [Pediococcus pentosaceus]